MPYVMVPVPEEHEEELMQEILKMTLRQKLTEWDPEGLRSVLEGSDRTAQAVIAELTRASPRRERLSRRHLAKVMGIDLLDLSAVVDQVNARCSSRSLPYLILAGPPPRGTGDHDDEVLYLTEVAAELLSPMLAKVGV